MCVKRKKFNLNVFHQSCLNFDPALMSNKIFISNNNFIDGTTFFSITQSIFVQEHIF